MATGPRLEHKTYKVKELIEYYRNGRIVIPEFQRDYVWSPKRASDLIDSLYRGFPISSLLLWVSADDVRARRQTPRPIPSGEVNWLIDGQQRVITLARTLSGEEGIDVMFHPDQGEFRLASAAMRKDKNWFRISDLWDDEHYRQLRRNLDNDRFAEKREARFEMVREILNYEVPVVRMIDHSFKDAVDAFKRINTLGVKLKQEDIESAQVAARHSGFIAGEVVPFLAKIREQGFHRLNVMHLFRVCAFVAKPDGRNRTPLHELEKKEVSSAWDKTKRATEQAIGLIRSELGLVNMNILWSGALIVPIIALCAITPPQKRDSRAYVSWLALAALLHRYSGSSETALDQDLKACRAQDPVRALLSNLKKIRTFTAEPKDFSGSLADRSGLLVLYIACLNRGLLDFYSGSKIVLQPNVDRHHILPKGQFPDKSRTAADNIANIAFINGSVNKSIGQSGPEVYLKNLKSKVLESQCIPNDKNLWSIEQAEEFWKSRRELLAESFNEYIRKGLPKRRV